MFACLFHQFFFGFSRRFFNLPEKLCPRGGFPLFRTP